MKISVPALYLHVPFCKKICPFCSFAVRRDRLSLHLPYLYGILDELKQRSEKIAQDETDFFLDLESINFGGGTPSRLSVSEIKIFMQHLKEQISWNEKTEISLEMNPEDVDSGKIEELQNLGINRISLGGQSFQSSTLAQLNRVHDAQQLRHAVQALEKSSLENWNLDLMFGVPGQTFSSFQEDVEEALSWKPTHISLYGLEIHPQTSFGHNSEIKQWEADHLEQFEEMYLWSMERLSQAGLIQYEVSNFAREGFQGKNNLLVWDGKPYLGLGVGAHSYINEKRWGNIRSVRSYLQQLEKQLLPLDFVEKLTTHQKASEKMMLDLRRPQGIHLENWIQNYNIEWSPHYDSFISRLCLEDRACWNGQNLCLTPKGMLLADGIAAQLIPD